MIEIVAISAAFGFAIGTGLGRVVEARLWRQKAANPEYRTAIRSGGKFYYVLPEHEYLGLTIEYE